MVVVISNAPEADAPRIAEALVKERRAACVNLLAPVRSIYTWKGELCDDAEVPLLIKVADSGVSALVERLSELHPYDVPEIVVLPVDVARSHPGYVAWVRAHSGG
ncbi:MAG: divalent-cation tolerance protein CutA [Deltaproteobacteria bacterium]|nr:MAG: divalent-cation tolerance protein CutA [Deltaproteobacteria bacterium]